MGNASTLHSSKWRQGTIIPHPDVGEGNLPVDVRPDDQLILISHDCDIVHSSYAAEPFVEYIVARPKPPEAKDGRLFHGKNPRRLQLFAKRDGIEQLYEINIHDKHRMDRVCLEHAEPYGRLVLAPGDVHLLGRWVGKRYCRPSFPSAFNDRISRISGKIDRAMWKFGVDVTGTFIAFLSSDGELPSSDPYEIVVQVVITPEAAKDDARERTAIKLVTELTKLFGQCEGINAEVALAGEDEFSLADFRHSRLWDYEYISAANDEHEYLGGG